MDCLDCRNLELCLISDKCLGEDKLTVKDLKELHERLGITFKEAFENLPNREKELETLLLSKPEIEFENEDSFIIVTEEDGEYFIERNNCLGFGYRLTLEQTIALIIDEAMIETELF